MQRITLALTMFYSRRGRRGRRRTRVRFVARFRLVRRAELGAVDDHIAVAVPLDALAQQVTEILHAQIEHRAVPALHVKHVQLVLLRADRLLAANVLLDQMRRPNIGAGGWTARKSLDNRRDGARKNARTFNERREMPHFQFRPILAEMVTCGRNVEPTTKSARDEQ